MTDIRFTASTSEHGTQLFRNEDDFIQYLDSLWRTPSWDRSGRRYQAEQLWEREPERYPCLMLTNGTMSNSEGPDWIINHYLYDVEVLDGESENAWRFELDEAA